MRPIKFRAWDKRNKAYIHDIQYSDGMGIDDPFECFGDALDNDDYVVEQYTGLKDQNGVEIYEDDLVKIIAADGDSFIAPIKYHVADDYPAFDVDEQYVPDSWCFQANALQTVMFDDSKIMVVGNVYENPELLEADE